MTYDPAKLFLFLLSFNAENNVSNINDLWYISKLHFFVIGSLNLCTIGLIYMQVFAFSSTDDVL